MLPAAHARFPGHPSSHPRGSFLRSFSAFAACGVWLGSAAGQTPPPGNVGPGYGTPPPQAPLQAGGLTPPPTQPATPTPTQRTLERAEREDAGRGLEFIWLNAEAGYEYICLQCLGSDELLDGSLLADSGSAFTFGGGAGVRLIFLTIGARFRLAQATDWNLWTLNGEVGLHIPLGALEPYVVLGAGYASLGSFSGELASTLLSAGDIEVSGFNARLGGGLDWYLDPLLSVGAQGTLDLLVLSRSGAGAGAVGAAALYAQDVTSVGLGATVTGVVGVHF
jgi:hypothetical protein